MIYDAIKDKYKCPIELVILMKNVFFLGEHILLVLLYGRAFIYFLGYYLKCPQNNCNLNKHHRVWQLSFLCDRAVAGILSGKSLMSLRLAQPSSGSEAHSVPGTRVSIDHCFCYTMKKLN